MYAIITENDVSQWDDDTGVIYHFPKRYQKYLATGTKVIYYKGKIKDKKYSAARQSDKPHYFGIATIGEVYPDKNSSKGDLFALIEEYQGFKQAVIAKTDNGYYEIIPDNKKTNYWRDGVRYSNKSVYDKIVSDSAIEQKPKIQNNNLNDLDNCLE